MPLKRSLTLPAKLSYTALGLAVAACSGETSPNPPPADAAGTDAAVAEASDDAPPVGDAAACDAQMFCGSNGTVDGAVCPGFVCDLSQCPNGCEPFV